MSMPNSISLGFVFLLFGVTMVIMMGDLCHCIVALLREERLLLRSGSASYAAALHGCGTSPVSLSYTIATVFQLYHSSYRIMR